MTPFESAIETFTGFEQAAILGRLQSWSKETSLGTRVPSNLRAERFLPALPDMRELQAVVLRNAASTSNVLEDAYRRECQSHTLRGGPVGLTTLPAVLGRAVDRSVWINCLIDRHLSLFSNSRRLVREFVDRLVNDRWYAISYPESQSLMSKYAAWVTWNEHDLTDDPFAFCKTNRADEARACLGLLTNRKGRSPFLLLLVYDRPADHELIRPTVADAATYPFFRPPPLDLGDAHGWTLPWPEEEVERTLPGATSRSRPEALHKPIRVLHLKLPLRCLS